VISKETIRGGFPIKSLGDVAEFLDSQRRPITASDRVPGPYPYYGANGQQDSVADYIFDEPLILLAEDGGLFDQPDRGIAYSIEGKTWVNNHAHVLRARDCVQQKYLVRVLENYDVTPWITGSTRAKLTKAGASKIQIPLPPLAEQKRIAGILDAADALRAKRRESLAQLDTLLQSTFLEMFGDPVTNPMGWEELPVTEACEHVVDCVNRTAPLADRETPFKMIRTTNIRHGVVDLHNVRFVEEETFHKWNRRLVPRSGDVLLTREAPVGEAGMLRGDEHVFLGQRIMLYRANPRRMAAEYLLYSFMGAGLQRQFDRHGSGSTVKHLPLPACRSFQVLIPPVDLQRRFAAIVESVEQQKASQRAHLEELDTLFASLQSRAFNGEV